MQKKIIKSVLVVAATLTASVLFGIIGVGRRYSAIMPANFPASLQIGFILTVLGLLISLATSIFILRYFIFFTKTQVIDTEGNTVSDNSSIAIGSAKVPPIVIASASAIVSMICIGMGIGMLLDSITLYVVYILSITLITFSLATIIFLFSVIKHKIRRRFAWIAAGVFLALSLFIFSHAVPAMRDMHVSEDELTAITGTVSRTSPHTGFLAGPGKSEIVIKGTSGDTITLRYSGDGTNLKTGGRYTFYYLPNTRLIDKVNQAENIKY